METKRHVSRSIKGSEEDFAGLSVLWFLKLVGVCVIVSKSKWENSHIRVLAIEVVYIASTLGVSF